MEKGALSDPNSDSTAVEAAPKWPSDIWKWSRNNSDASTQNARSSPVVAMRDAVPREPTARPQVHGFDEEEKRRRKVNTWYTAAADLLPELDKERQDRRVIDVDEIPRYRDDDVRTKEVARVTNYNTVQQEQDNNNRNNEQIQEKGGEEPRVSPSSSDDDCFAVPVQPATPVPAAITKTIAQPSQRSSLGVPTMKSNAPSQRDSLAMKSNRTSQRSSWGMRRDVWNLMPSVVLWDRNSLAPHGATIFNTSR